MASIKYGYDFKNVLNCAKFKMISLIWDGFTSMEGRFMIDA